VEPDRLQASVFLIFFAKSFARVWIRRAGKPEPCQVTGKPKDFSRKFSGASGSLKGVLSKCLGEPPRPLESHFSFPRGKVATT
jgi:hypothetical protein